MSSPAGGELPSSSATPSSGASNVGPQCLGLPHSPFLVWKKSGIFLLLHANTSESIFESTGPHAPLADVSQRGHFKHYVLESLVGEGRLHAVHFFGKLTAIGTLLLVLLLYLTV